MIHLMIVIQFVIKIELGMEKTLVITLMKTRERILNRKTTPKVIARLNINNVNKDETLNKESSSNTGTYIKHLM